MRNELCLFAAAVALGGCSWLPFVGDDDADTKESKSLPPLEVPPGLSTPEFDTRLTIPGETISASRSGAASARQDLAAASASEASEESASDSPVESEEFVTEKPDKPAAKSSEAQVEATGEAPLFTSVRSLKAGDVRWIEIGGNPEKIWPHLKTYWESQSTTLSRADAKAGIMETQWKSRPGNGTASNKGSKSPSYRDKYRIRVEREADSLTNVYIVHSGAQKSVADKKDSWQSVPHDPEKEAALVDSLFTYLGGQAPVVSADDNNKKAVKKEGPAQAALEVAESLRLERVAGVPALIVPGQYGKIWALTGDALNQSGLQVRQQDRGRGVYAIKASERGLISRMIGAGEDKLSGKYEIHLLDQGKRTLITAHAPDNKALSEQSANVLLKRLEGSIRVRQQALSEGPKTPPKTPPVTAKRKSEG